MAVKFGGIYDLSEVDKLHYIFCKFILGVRPQTSNAAVLGDLGRITLSLICKYVNDTVFSKSNRRHNWITAVKQYVDDLGCIDV